MCGSVRDQTQLTDANGEPVGTETNRNGEVTLLVTDTRVLDTLMEILIELRQLRELIAERT